MTHTVVCVAFLERSGASEAALLFLEIYLVGVFMYGHRKKGHKMSRGKSRKMFSGTAQWIHPMNVHSEPMRGGFRL